MQEICQDGIETMTDENDNLPTFGLVGNAPDSVRAERVWMTLLSTTQPSPNGGRLRVTTWRVLVDPPETTEMHRAVAIFNYLNRSGRVSFFPHGEVRFPGSGRRYRLPSVPDDAWRPYKVAIDANGYNFKRVTFDDSWLALGIVDDFEVAIEAYGYDPLRLDLVRIDRVANRGGLASARGGEAAFLGPLKVVAPRCPACGTELEEYRFGGGRDTVVCGSCEHIVRAARPATVRSYRFGYSSPYDPRRWLALLLTIERRWAVTKSRQSGRPL
jgi:hypothetical protein